VNRRTLVSRCSWAACLAFRITILRPFLDRHRKDRAAG
jgi:hypothetical protein